MKNKFATPVLKWVGGKRQLLPEIRKYVPKHISTYYEPFIGGGAVLFDIQPSKAVINDVNPELINLYNVIKDNVDELIEVLATYPNDEDFFYDIRAWDRNETEFNERSNVERAARIHYLNKTCYNGLFRVNLSGQFNTPFGRYRNPNIKNERTLRGVHKLFNDMNIKMLNGDFEKAVSNIRRGAFVYFDPPYDPISDSSSFTGYAKGGFDRDEQKRLKKLCDKLNERGVKFLLSNSSTDFIHDLYNEDDYKIETIKAKRAINSKGDKRGEIDEVLIRNYE